MGLPKHPFSIAFLLILSSLAKAPISNQDTIDESLDTLAEILTVSRIYSPQGIEGEKMVEGAISGLLEQLDPHSSYYNKERYQTMKEDQRGTFYGIGIMVGLQNKRLTVITPLEGTPAFEAGVRAGDVILQIDAVRTEDVDLYEAIRLLRGVEGSFVKLKLKRSHISEELEFTLKRAEIPTNNVRASFMLDKTTGYVALKDFGQMAVSEMTTAIKNLESEGLEKMILDLRGNPGGLLPQAIDVAGLFLPGRKLIVSTQGRMINSSQEYFSRKRSRIKQVPLIVLIDRGSASASEIVAGAIQDHDRGLILGVTSWGKGLVQSVFPLAQGTKGLALTTSRYYTPSGRNIQGDYDSLESYYNPESSESLYFSPEENPSSAVFKTVHGREVLEMRGITPDVYISFPEIPAPLQTLEAKHGVFFNFSADFQGRLGSIDEAWRADERVLARFKNYLAEKEIETRAPELYPQKILQKITYQTLYIATPEWAWKYLMNQDHHVKAAMGLFPNAAELLGVYNGESELRSGYAQELKRFARLNRTAADEPQ